jgi:hypothetical protein
MTQATFRSFARGSLAALLLLSSVVPVLAKGMPDGSSTDTPATARGMACARFTAFADVLQARLDDRQTAIDGRRDERKAKLDELRSKHETSRLEMKDTWQRKWTALIAQLQGDAADDAQKAAIAAFKTAMEAAFQGRMTAVEAADKTFRDGLVKLDTDKKTAVANALAAYKVSVKAALDKAKADCGAGKDPETVRANLKSALDASHAKLQDALTGIAGIGDKVAALVQTRHDAIDAAHTDFKTAAEKAHDALKAALQAAMPQSATDTPETNGVGNDQGSASGTQQ